VRGIEKGKTKTRKGKLKGHDATGDEDEEDPADGPVKRARVEEEGPRRRYMTVSFSQMSVSPLAERSSR
jgi:hypothetical protein